MAITKWSIPFPEKGLGSGHQLMKQQTAVGFRVAGRKDDEGPNMPMPLIPDMAVFQRKLATLPVVTYQAGETVLSAASTTGQLLILKKARSQS